MSCLSVIVPCYNGEKFIGRCLESLVNQTLQDIEIIVINDGSTDNSQDIIDSYANKYHNIKAYKIPNSGIADARNFGVSKVETPYFGFLDCDDYTDVTMFEKMYNKAIETNAQVVVSNFYWVKGKKKKLEKEGPYNTGKDMLIHLFAVLWNKIYDTEFVRSTNIRFPSGNRYEDAYFLYCLAPNIERLAFVDEAFVHYVQHDNSITHNNNEEVKIVSKKIESKSFKKGDKVEHAMFGLGVVTKVDGNFLNVAFKAPYGIKKIVKNHPSIKKV